MRNLGSQIIAGLFNKSLEQPTGGQANYPEEKVQELLSAMILRAMDGEDVLKDCPDCEALADLMTAVVEHAKEEDDSPEVKACVSKKIPILINEGYPQAQSVAIAYSICRKNPDVANKGKEVPEPVKRKVEGPVRYLSYADLAEFGRERLKSMTRPPVPVQKAGTSEGAKAGWETRRGGSGAEPTGTMEAARAVTTRALEDFDEGIKGAEAARREVDPKDKASRDKLDVEFRAKEGQAGKAVARVMNIIDGLKGTPGIDEKERSEVGFLLMRADYVFGPGDSRLQHEHPDVWEEGFIPSVRTYLTRANDLVASAKAGTKKALDETPEVSKAGTSEGAKLGWETRRGGGIAAEEKPKKLSPLEISDIITGAVGNTSIYQNSVKVDSHGKHNIISFSAPPIWFPDSKKVKNVDRHFAISDSGEPVVDKPPSFDTREEAIAWQKKKIDEKSAKVGGGAAEAEKPVKVGGGAAEAEKKPRKMLFTQVHDFITNAVGNASYMESTLRVEPHGGSNIISFEVPHITRTGEHVRRHYAISDSGEPWMKEPPNFATREEAIAWQKKKIDEEKSLNKVGTSEGAKLGWETRRGSASVSDGPKEFGTFMEDAIAQRDTPEAKATKEMAENLKDSDVPLRDAFDAVKKRVDQAEALAQETFKRYGPALSKYHTDNINREREAIKRGMEVAERHVRENSRGHTADAIGNAIDGADLMSVWVSSAVGDVWRDKTEEKKVKKSGTSEGAKLGWETRRGGAPAEEPKAGMPSREKWDSMQSDADAMHDANDKFQRWQSQGDDAPPARRGADPGPSKAFEGHLNALQDAAPKAAKVAEGLKGVPGVDEEKRGKAEAAMRGFASNGVGENDTSKYDDAVGDIWNMLDDARASHDPKYAAKTKEIKTMEKEVANLANALFPKWISQGSRVASPGVVKEIRKEFLTGLYKKRIAQEDVTEGEVPIEKSVVTLSRMPEAVETFAAPPANWQEGYTPIERQNLLAWVEAVDKARQTDIFRRGSMSAPFSPEFESMESRQSIGKWIAENPDPVAYYVAQNVNLASRPSVRTMKDRVVQIAQDITTMAQRAAK